ncbi:hypothetical protein R1sor_014725 [Riccia sorocarpa]|uniref:Uncharacterized protein n=1 Tax=Riccia sorocarpa TaxID=122646 RepID=A0ABD3HC16_9MARC
MRREGKVHGSFVRMSKDDDYLDYRINGTLRRPTNLSKLTAKCPRNSRSCYLCHAGRPWSKAMCKTRGMHKCSDLDITANYKLDQFSFKCRHSSQVMEDSEDDDQQQHQNMVHSEGDHRTPDLVITIASFLRGMRRGKGAAALALDGGASEETLQHQDESLQNWEAPAELSDEIVSEADLLSRDESPQEGKGVPDLSDMELDAGFDCGWFSVEFSDSVQLAVDVDDWYLKEPGDFISLTEGACNMLKAGGRGRLLQKVTLKDGDVDQRLQKKGLGQV